MLDFPGDIGALPRGLTGLCSSSAIIVSFDLVVSHTKLRLALAAQLTVLVLASLMKLSLNKVSSNKDDVLDDFGLFSESDTKELHGRGGMSSSYRILERNSGTL